VTPPGYYTAGGATTKCPGGTYRPNWKTGTEAAACLSCGEGVQTDTTDRVAVYNITTLEQTFIRITTSSDDCCEYLSFLLVSCPLVMLVSCPLSPKPL
jgi:hypothetical protein